jgi:hypothetical protein
MAAKGPLALGSSIQAAWVDEKGKPSGKTYLTQTTDDLGSFVIQGAQPGFYFVEATGYFYDEVTGRSSTQPITLRAYMDTRNGPQAGESNINLVTHLTSRRVTTLVEAGTQLPKALAQANDELRRALPFPSPSSFDGRAMQVVGEDSDENAYLLVLSAALLSLADSEGGEENSAATLSQLLNQLTEDLANDGQLEQGLRERLRQRQSFLSAPQLQARMEAWLRQKGSALGVPDIHRILDSDLDGVANNQDTCELISNPDQAAVPPGLCHARDVSTYGGSSRIGDGRFPQLLSGDVDNDGKTDAIFLGSTAGGLFLKGNGAAGFSPPTVALDPGYPTGPYHLFDVNSDGRLDLLSDNGDVLTGDGSGRFQPGSPLTGTDADGQSFQISSPQWLDYDGDGIRDLLGFRGARTRPVLMFGTAAGTLQNAQALPIPTTTQPGAPFESACMNVGDFNGDGLKDIALIALFNTYRTDISRMALYTGNRQREIVLQELSTTVHTCYAVADISGDGVDDWLTRNSLFPSTGLTLGDRVSPLRTNGSVPSPFDPQLFADFNSDGRTDWLTTSGRAKVVLNGPDGTLRDLGPIPLRSSNIPAVSTADYDNDGRLDLSLVQSYTGGEFDVSLIRLEGR